MRLKLKSLQGISIVTLDDDATLHTLLKTASVPSELNNFQLLTIKEVRRGYPLNSIDLADDKLLLKILGFKSGEQVIIEFNTGTDVEECRKESSFINKHNKSNNSDFEISSVFLEDMNKYLILRNVPDDNSCLFNAISYAINGFNSYKVDGILPPPYFRSVVANAVLENPDLYNEAVLGRSNDTYSAWILKKDSWGGAIELGILASKLAIKIVCLDVELGNLLNFEDESDPPKYFAILVYSGIHYDLLVLNHKLSLDENDKKNDISTWAVASEDSLKIIEGAKILCDKLRLQNYSTNTTTFRVRCLVCYKILVGELGASRHANETQHFNFGEVK